MKALLPFRTQQLLLHVLVLVGCVVFPGNFSPAAAQSTQTGPSPICSLAANAGNDIQAYQGSPLILDATLYHPNHASKSTLITPLLINAKNGSWANTIQLVVTDSNGATQNWPIRLIAPPSGTLILDSTTEGDLTWVVDPSATASIAPGTYTVVATIDTTSSAGTIGWSGGTTSDSVSIQIGSLPSPVALDLQEEQAELLAMYDHLTGNDAKAISDLQAFLAQQPNDVSALELEGNLYEAMGQPDNALDAYDEAVGAFFVSTTGPLSEPPADLSIPQGTLRSALFSQTVQAGVPQVSIQLIGQGAQSAGVDFLDLQITNSGSGVAENVSLNQLALLTASGTGQVSFNNVLSPRLPIHTDALDVNASTTVRIFVSVQGTVGSLALTETGTAADIFGTQSTFGQTQNITLSTNGGGGAVPGSLTITAANATRVYGQSNPALNNVSYSGFVNGDGPGSLSGTLNCVTTATPSSPVGTYPITCSGVTSPNYSITFSPGTLSVTPAALVIVANSASRQFGQVNPPFTASFIGFLNMDSLASLAGALSCASAATPSSSVSGSPYQITCSGVTSSNYSITFAPGLLSVTKATPTISWTNPANITQGTPLGAQQLNATANIAGSFVYTPPAGTVLPAGAAQILSVIFTPSDTMDYNGVSSSVVIDVSAAALLPLTITVGNATQQYGKATPPLNNVTYSGFAAGDTPSVLTGTLSCQTTATPTSSAGTYPITCSGLSSTKYAISLVPGILTIAPAPLSVTANNATRPYGQSNPAFTGVLSGLANGDSLASLSGSLSCTSPATASSSVSGSPYAITCSGLSSANYSITFIPGMLTITATPLTVTANNVTVKYGQAPVLNGASYLGLAGGDTPASLAGTLNCVTTATQSSPVGNYPINCSGVTSPNYTISFVQGSLTVTPTALIITAGNASRAFGLANPLLNNISASGFANGDTLASLAGALACTTTATPASPAGTYPITCTGLSSPNYSITFLPGTLTIKADALTVAANNAARQYGSTNPSFTASFSGFVNGDTPASLGGSLACTTPATPTSSVSGGPYPINCSGLTSANYAISYVPGALIITPAPLTVAANNAARPYGSKNPAFTGSVAGLLNSDPVTASFGTSATPPSSVGTYPITPTVIGAQPVLGNYSIGLINGTLTVGPESTSLSVTLNPATISAGQSTIATVMLTAPDMVIPIDPSVLGSITLTSTVATDVLSNNGVCTPLPSATPGVASCTLTVTSAEPNGRTLVANFAGSASLAAATGSVNLIVTTPVEGQRSCISSDFLNSRINGGDYIWFNSIFRIRFVHRQKINISFSGSSVQFRYRDRNGKLINVNQSVPDAHIVIDPSVRFGSTTFDSLKQVWITTIPWDLDDNAFLSGMSWRVPASGLPSDVEPVTWCGTFASDVPGMDIGWRWAAAAYSSFSSNDAVLGVKPMDTDRDGPFGNDDRAGTPDNFKRFVIPGARGWGGRNYTGSYSRAKEID